MAEWFDLSIAGEEVNDSTDEAILSGADREDQTSINDEDLTEQMFELSSQELYEEGMRIITNMQNNLMSQLQEDSLRNLIDQANVLLADVGDRLRTFNHILSYGPSHSSRDSLQPHRSCSVNENPNVGMLTRKRKRDLGVRQSDLKCRFTNMHSEGLKFFRNHNCCVCMETYKEIIDSDHHLVVPTCGHPLCCRCADKILLRKPECPICKVKLTKGSFQMMVFNKDSQPDLKKQKLYL